LKIDMTLFLCRGRPIWIKFHRLVQNDTSTEVIWSKSKPEVEFLYGRRSGEFNGMSSKRHVSHCWVLSPGTFNAMSSQVPVLRDTLQGAAAWRIQCHVIPELRITLWGAATWRIQCHDPTVTFHVRHIDEKLSCRRETERRFVSLNILLSHSRSLEMALLRRACVSPYLYFIETMSVCRTAYGTFSVKE